MLVRLMDYFQFEQTTVMFTALSLNNIVNEQTDEGVSSLVDAWILIRDIESNGERNRGLYMKSRGMAHSNQVREFVIDENGLELVDVYHGSQGVLTGSARIEHILREQTGLALQNHALSQKDREILRKRALLEAKIQSLKTEFESEEEELNKVYVEEEIKKTAMDENRKKMTDLRKGTSRKDKNSSSK